MQPLLIHAKRFPPRNYHAITIFPVIIYRDQALGEEEIEHERVHLYQQAALLVVPFYILYVAFWIIMLLKYKDREKAYRNIPFERSAYILESKRNVRAITKAYHWFGQIAKRQ